MTTFQERQRKYYVVAASLLVLLALSYFFRESILEGFADLSAWIDSKGRLAPIIYIGVFVVAVPLFIPTTPPLLAAGMLFGLWPGILYAFIGNALGGLLAFWLSRTRVQRLVLKLLQRYETLDALNTAIKQDGVRTAILLRMSPLIPGPLLNYALGMTALRTRHYLIATIGTLPVVLAYTFLGSTLGRFAEMSNTATLSDMPGSTAVVMAAGLIATILGAVIIARRATTLLQQRQPSGESPANDDDGSFAAVQRESDE